VKPTEINEILENGKNTQNIQSDIKDDDSKKFKNTSNLENNVKRSSEKTGLPDEEQNINKKPIEQKISLPKQNDESTKIKKQNIKANQVKNTLRNNL